MSKYILFIFCVCFSVNSICQINIDRDIIKLVDTSIIIAKKKGIDGYKIQIYMGSDRQEAEKIRKQFIKKVWEVIHFGLDWVAPFGL